MCRRDSPEHGNPANEANWKQAWQGSQTASQTAYADGLLMAIMANLLASVEGWGPWVP